MGEKGEPKDREAPGRLQVITGYSRMKPGDMDLSSTTVLSIPLQLARLPQFDTVRITSAAAESMSRY